MRSGPWCHALSSRNVESEHLSSRGSSTVVWSNQTISRIGKFIIVVVRGDEGRATTNISELRIRQWITEHEICSSKNVRCDRSWQSSTWKDSFDRDGSADLVSSDKCVFWRNSSRGCIDQWIDGHERSICSIPDRRTKIVARKLVETIRHR